MLILSMTIQDHNKKISYSHRNINQLVISLVNFYHQYRSVLKLILEGDRDVVAKGSFICLSTLLPMNVISFTWLLFNPNVHPLHRLMLAGIGLAGFLLVLLALLPFASISKRLHEPGKVFVPLQTKIVKRFTKLKLTHLFYYELVASKHKLAFHVGPHKITHYALFEGLCLYIYSYLLVLSYIYSK